MLKSIEITLAHPICGCKKQISKWAIGMTGLEISCDICKTVIVMPYNTLRASITYAKPYPEGQYPSGTSNIVKLVQKD